MGPMLVKVGFSGFHLVSDRWVVPSRCLCTDGLEGGQAAPGCGVGIRSGQQAWPDFRNCRVGGQTDGTIALGALSCLGF